MEPRLFTGRRRLTRIGAQFVFGYADREGEPESGEKELAIASDAAKKRRA